VALDWLVDLDARIVLNVNFPNVPLDELRGVERARLAAFGAVQTTVTESGVGYVKLAYSDVDADLELGTDAAALAAGIACFTPLRVACEADGLDTSALDHVFDRWRAGGARAFAARAQRERFSMTQGGNPC
jgi:broad specificity polyphosphatase/5'/3'-nucleotidase SurE